MTIQSVFAKLKTFMSQEVEPALESAASKFSYKGLSGGEAVISSLLDFVVADCKQKNMAMIPVDVLNELCQIFIKPGIIYDVIHDQLLAEIKALLQKQALPAGAVSVSDPAVNSQH